jgi:hypothetical protein
VQHVVVVVFVVVVPMLINGQWSITWFGKMKIENEEYTSFMLIENEECMSLEIILFS